MGVSLSCWPPAPEQERYLARCFAGDIADLDINFDLPRPELVTSLLSSCLHHSDGELVNARSTWQWTVSERLQGLLAIANASIGNTSTAIATCSNELCRGTVELELELASFASAPVIAKMDWLSPRGEKFFCRLPTGQDQRDWYKHIQHSVDESWFIARLLEATPDTQLPAELPVDWIDSLGASLADVDPLTALTLAIDCPFCAQALNVEVDLEWLLIDGLRSLQRRMIEQVHCLASHYHWSEKDIVALPQWRREKYLARLVEGL
ncbi:MAG: hypothetical protein B0W54_01610 [Cellvibrio sp. 79]|nr:MAG: hypothetical protein B0W54_01610 [Cellvibrio sp. 79]